MLLNKTVFSVVSFLLPCLFLTLLCEKSMAQEYKWSQELGLYSISPDVSSSEVTGPGLPPTTAINVDDGGSYLLTTTYHQSEQLSYEFFYSWTNELAIEADGSIQFLGEIGSLDYLAPTLMANWTFGDPTWSIRPFIGLGVNRMIYLDEAANDTLGGALGGSTAIEIEDTWGLAFTAGLTWSFSDRLYASLAYVQIPTDTTATITTAAVGTERTVNLDVDLDIYYLNFGYRF